MADRGRIGNRHSNTTLQRSILQLAFISLVSTWYVNASLHTIFLNVASVKQYLNFQKLDQQMSG